MNCAKFRAGLQEAIEQRQPIPADVRQHGESCPIEECQQEWGDFLLVERALAQWLLAAPVDLAERVLQSLQTEPPIRNLPIPGTSDFRRLSEGTTNANGSTRQFNWTAVSLTALTLCLLILPAVAPPPGARLVSQAISEKEDLSTRGPLAPDVTQDELEAAKEVYAQWMESASERLNRTASLVLLDEIPNENSTPSHGWFGLWSKEIEKYEEEIGTTLMEFVESTKMDQS